MQTSSKPLPLKRFATQRRAVAWRPLALAVGCGGPADEDATPATSVGAEAPAPAQVLGGEKADAIGDRALEVETWGAPARVRSGRHIGYSRVIADEDGRVQVSTERLIFQPDTDETRLHVEVGAKGFIASHRDELLFTLHVREAGSEGPWTPVTFKDDDTLEHFRSFTFDLGKKLLTVDGRVLSTDRDFDFTLAVGEAFSSDVEFAVEVFPAATWFGLAGDYTYDATITCDGRPCRGHLTPSALKDRYRLDRADQHPESGDFDPIAETFYVGTLYGGGITAVDAADGERRELTKDEEGWGALGVRVDAEAGRLWSCAVRTDVDGAYPGVVRVHDLNSGALIHSFDLARAYDDGSCNDLVLASADVAFVTDRENPNVYRLDLGKDAVEVWASDDDLLDSIGIGTNGIALSPDGERLVITNYLPSRLMVVDLDEPGEVEEIELEGDWFHEVLGGADGIRFVDNTLFVAFPKHLARVQPLSADWRTAHVTMADLPEGGHSGVMVVHDDLYMVNGQLVTYVAGGEPAPFYITRFDWTLLD